MPFSERRYSSGMKRKLAIPQLLAAWGFCAVAGCTTIASQQRREAAQSQGNMDRLSADVARLRERVEALAVVQQELGRQVDALQTASREEDARTRDNLAALSQTVAAVGEAQKNVRQEVVDTMAKRVADMMAQTPKASSPPRAERGYEHVVQAGQTLSEIAAAYKVKVPDIIKANRIEKPNALRVGQKLFIPE